MDTLPQNCACSQHATARSFFPLLPALQNPLSLQSCAHHVLHAKFCSLHACKPSWLSKDLHDVLPNHPTDGFHHPHLHASLLIFIIQLSNLKQSFLHVATFRAHMLKINTCTKTTPSHVISCMPWLSPWTSCLGCLHEHHAAAQTSHRCSISTQISILKKKAYFHLWKLSMLLKLHVVAPLTAHVFLQHMQFHLHADPHGTKKQDSPTGGSISSLYISSWLLHMVFLYRTMPISPSSTRSLSSRISPA